MNDLVTILNGEPRTTTLAVAKGLNMPHASILRLLRTHQSDLEEFGRVGFEIEPFETAGGMQSREVASLNEQQATLILTYIRNTPISRMLKKRLVRAFYELKNASTAPLASTQLKITAERYIELLENESKMLRGRIGLKLIDRAA